MKEERIKEILEKHFPFIDRSNAEGYAFNSKLQRISYQIAQLYEGGEDGLLTMTEDNAHEKTGFTKNHSITYALGYRDGAREQYRADLVKTEQAVEEEIKRLAYEDGYKQAIIFLDFETEQAVREERERVIKEIEKHIWYRGLAEVGMGKNRRTVPCIQITKEDWQALKEGK